MTFYLQIYVDIALAVNGLYLRQDLGQILGWNHGLHSPWVSYVLPVNFYEHTRCCSVFVRVSCFIVPQFMLRVHAIGSYGQGQGYHKANSEGHISHLLENSCINNWFLEVLSIDRGIGDGLKWSTFF